MKRVTTKTMRMNSIGIPYCFLDLRGYGMDTVWGLYHGFILGQDHE